MLTAPRAEEPSELERLAIEGVALDGCAPWRWFPVVAPERTLRAFATGGLRDSVSWIDFARALSLADSAYFESEVGWIAATNIQRGASAEIHGGAFAGRRGEATAIHAPTRALLDAMYAWWNVGVLLSSYPEHNKLAAAWDAQYGFVRTGVIPLAGVWGGKARNLVLTARFRVQEAP